MKEKSILHIHFHNDKWIVRGNKELVAKREMQFQKRSDAVKTASQKFSSEHHIIVVHDKNGMITKIINRL